VDALEAYLEKYPDSVNRGDALRELSDLRRSHFHEWTLFDIINKVFPAYFKLSSLMRMESRAAITTKFRVDPATPLRAKYPTASAAEQTDVFDCNSLAQAVAELTVRDDSGEMLYHYKWAEPRYLDLSIGTQVVTGSALYTLRNLVCFDVLHTPILGKEDLASSKTSVSSTVAGDGEVFFIPISSELSSRDQKDVALVFKLHDDQSINFPAGFSVPSGAPVFRTEVDRVLMKCSGPDYLSVQTEYYDASNSLVHMVAADHTKELTVLHFVEKSPYALLQRMVCASAEVRQ
jgi:hypothetical protein